MDWIDKVLHYFNQETRFALHQRMDVLKGEPFDLRHYQELYPEIVSVGWLKEMDELGRNFPQLQKNLKNVEIIY